MQTIEKANDKRIEFVVPHKIIDKFDKLARKQGVTRSGLLKVLISEYLDKNK